MGETEERSGMKLGGSFERTTKKLGRNFKGNWNKLFELTNLKNMS